MRQITALLATASLLLASCGGSGESGPSVTAEDRAGAAKQHEQLLAEFGGRYDGDESAYLVRLGEKIAAAAGLEGQCTFTLVNTDVVNAFAVPGCYIYVTRGLMAIVGSEGELASVLAHEVGHIVGQHSKRQQKRSLWRGLGVLAVQMLTGSERLTRIAGEAATFFTLRYSRTQEYQADDLGLGFLQRAGYDPYAETDMLSALARQEQFLASTRGRDEARSIPEWARTHPLTGNRIERARQAAQATGVKPDALPEYEQRYLQAVDGLLYGDDPAQGFVIGRRFAHPVMRIGFDAPAGFTLTNSPQAILVEGPDGLRGEFGGGRIPAGGLQAYAEALLRQLLGDAPVRIGAGQAERVNGLRALFVPAAVSTQNGDIPLSIAVYEAPGGNAYHFAMVSNSGTASATALQPLFRSFHLLSEAEAQSLKPRRIRVVPAKPADTVASLAGQMAADDGKALFLLLNDGVTDQSLRTGAEVKLVRTAAK